MYQYLDDCFLGAVSSFASMQERAYKVLQETFGYHSFRGQQEDIVLCLISGGDAMVLMPTGGGKSLCYQIPSIVREGTGLIISPLIALMQDQVSALVRNGVQAAFLNSTLTPEQSRDVCVRFYRGELDLLYVSPERALMDGFIEMISKQKLSLIAIDEAHCVSQWGHDFRPEYIKLSVLKETFPDVPLIALTATADEATRRDIIKYLHLEDARHFVTSFDRPNITYYVKPQAVGKAKIKEDFLRFIKAHHDGDSGIVYCMTRREVEEVAAWLKVRGYDSLPYHAGLDDEERAANQRRFLAEEGLIMVATVAFGMGIDKPNVRFVAHFSLPSSIEAYYQETGRAGRDGLPSSAWMSYSVSDIIMRQRFISNSEADDLHKSIEFRKLRALLGFCEIVSCRRRALLEYFGEKTAISNCHNCDNCLHPPKVAQNGLILAQKAIACVANTGQLYGVKHIIDVLRGVSNERIVSRCHNRLKLYGSGKDISERQWHSIFRQLIAGGYLSVSMGEYGSLLLNARSQEIMKRKQDEFSLPIRLDSEEEKENKKPRSRANTKTKKAIDEGNSFQSDTELYQRLRQKRLEIARNEGVHPYTIFDDRTLLELASVKPKTLEELKDINGLGKVKIERYGKIILGIINA